MRKLIIFLLTTAIMFCAPIPVSAAQSEGNVNIYLPSFKVKINGVEMDNTYSKYPFIVYQDITYFPMTYSGCRFLGLETGWQNETTGLSIGKTGITVAYCPYTGAIRNAIKNKADIVRSMVTVNGKVIGNSLEPYPLLLFRNVTYFPMTWRFCVDELGWDYSYSDKNGLAVNSDNIRIEQIQMPFDKARDDYGQVLNSASQNVTVTDKYIYYQGTGGQIMQADITDVSKRKAIYQLPTTDGSSYVLSGLYTKKDAVYLSYHLGGGIMGSDQTFRLNEDGTTEKRGSHSYDFGDISIGIPDSTGMPSGGNLSIKTGTGDWKQLGNPNYLYGWKWAVNKNGGEGGSMVDTAYLDDDDLYILGFDKTYNDKNLTTGIYSFNIKTNETTRISEKEVWDFKADGGFLYYLSGGTFYKYSLKDGKETLIKTVTNTAEQFEVLNGHIYWQDSSDSDLYDLDSGKNMNQGAELDTMGLNGENKEYLVCTFKGTSNAKYRIMVFDRDGNIVFKTSDKAFCRNISIKGKTIYFYDCTTDTVCVGDF